ncbi:MAG: UDP-glucose 4-epimerase GalE [Candidatus Caenarcaniphilales bacterium]|nr:UDP-glucose 4-epimerase GalE [Candidatus Caenarcaniphilales bacterium]
MKVLITGCAGYIGSITSQTCLDNGYEVIGLDAFYTGFKKNIPAAVKVYEGDIADTDILQKIHLEHPDLDTVIHMAGFIEVAESVKEPEKYIENNFTKAKLMLDELIKLKFKNIIFSSTAAVYGMPKELSAIPESSELKPINPYGESKLMFEEYLREKADEINHIIFRFFNVAGAYDNLGECHEPETHLIPLILDFALEQRKSFALFGTDYPSHDGTAVRDYIHVRDLAKAHVNALKEFSNSSANLNQAYNLGYGKGFSVKEIIENIEKVLALKLDYERKDRRPGDPAYLVASPEKAKVKLSFEPDFNNIEKIISDAYNHRKLFWENKLSCKS